MNEEEKKSILKDGTLPEETLKEDGFLPCRVCGEYCVEFDYEEKDWFGRGEVYRANNMCIWEKPSRRENINMENPFWADDFRTEFATYLGTIEQWNTLQRGEEIPNRDLMINAAMGAMTGIINANGEKNGL
jgi:hypothetical protein